MSLGHFKSDFFFLFKKQNSPNALLVLVYKCESKSVKILDEISEVIRSLDRPEVEDLVFCIQMWLFLLAMISFLSLSPGLEERMVANGKS